MSHATLPEQEIAVLQGVREIIVLREPKPAPKAGELLIRITHAGICGSDLHYFRHGDFGSLKAQLPMYSGQELVGVVVDPNGIDDFSTGDRVAVEYVCPGLHSTGSLMGKHNPCDEGTSTATNNTSGCFANYVCATKTDVFKIPENVDSSVATMCEPLSVALHTYKLCGSRTHDLINGSAVIFGASTLGFCHLIILKQQGVRNVYIVDTSEDRREMALQLGATATFTSGEAFKAFDKKCELTVDCAATFESFDGCICASTVNGTLALVGIPEVGFLNFNAHQAGIKELFIISVRRSNHCLETCLDMLSSNPEIVHMCQHLISQEMPLHDIQRAFEMASEYENCFKIIIRPDIHEQSEIDMKIPIFKLEFCPGAVKEFQQKAADILTSGRPLSNNVYTRKFEDKFKHLVRAPYTIAVNSGTAALEIALRALGVRNKVVLTPSNTFFATQVAVQNAGATVGFVDAEADYMQMCPDALAKRLEARASEEIGAVILVHIGGLISPHYTRIRDACHRCGIPLVEDAAHAHLSHMNEEFAGTIGDVGAFSFFPTKVMTAGEAGMITTTNKTLYEAMQSIREFGKRIEDGSRLIQERPDGGINGKISEMTALLGVIECDRVAARIQRRAHLVDLYACLLNPNHYRVMKQNKGVCSYYKCIVFVLVDGKRDALRDYAREHDISFTGEVYFKGVHEMPAYTDHDERLPVTEYVCANHVCPPLYPEMTEGAVKRVCMVMNAFFDV